MESVSDTEFGTLFAEDPTPSGTIAPSTTCNKPPADPELVKRAVSLFSESRWTYKAAFDTEAIFFVWPPRREIIYVVFIADMDSAGSFCSCRDFAAENTCVHLLAMEHELAFITWVEEQERLIDDVEHPIHACAPYMHY